MQPRPMAETSSPWRPSFRVGSMRQPFVKHRTGARARRFRKDALQRVDLAPGASVGRLRLPDPGRVAGVIHPLRRLATQRPDIYPMTDAAGNRKRLAVRHEAYVFGGAAGSREPAKQLSRLE